MTEKNDRLSSFRVSISEGKGVRYALTSGLGVLSGLTTEGRLTEPGA